MMKFKEFLKLVILFPFVFLKNSYIDQNQAGIKQSLFDQDSTRLPVQPPLLKNAFNSIIAGAAVKSALFLVSRNPVGPLLFSTDKPVTISCPGALSSYTGTDVCVCPYLCKNCGNCADTLNSCKCMDGDNDFRIILNSPFKEDAKALEKEVTGKKRQKNFFDEAKLSICENDSCGNLFQTSASGLAMGGGSVIKCFS